MRLLITFTIILLAIPLGLAQPIQQTPVSNLNIDGELDLHSDSFFAEIVGVAEGGRRAVVEATSMRIVMERDSGPYPELQADSSDAVAEVIFEGAGRLFTELVREDHRITLVAESADVGLKTSQANLAPKPTSEVTRSGGYTAERQEEVFQLGPQFRIKNLDGILHVEGTFSFNLYEWDAVIEHAEGRESFWTGERITPMEPLGGMPNELGTLRNLGGRVDWQTAYVYVEDGTLDLELREEDGPSASYSMGSAWGLTSGAFELTQPTNDDTEGEAPNIIRFRGSYGTLLEVPRQDHLYASLSVPVPKAPTSDEQSSANEEPVATEEVLGQQSEIPFAPASTPTPTLPSSDLPAWSYLLALPALALVTAGVVYVRPIRRMHKLEDAYDLSIFGYLVDNAPPLLRSRRFGAQASVMYTVALLEERGPDEAEAHLTEVRPRSRPTGATYDYLMARIRAAQTRFDEARRHVHACLTEEPAFVMEIRHNPSLEFLMRPPSDPGEGYA